MKLHTKLTAAEVRAALARAQEKGLVAYDVHFAVWVPGRSMTHPHGYEIQLGTFSQDSLPRDYTDQHGRRLNVRRARNTNHGDGSRWAATWHEWGWLIAEIFAADPNARWGQDPARSRRPQHAWGYFSPADFHDKTEGQFEDPAAVAARERLGELRAALRAESISYGELAELQSLASYIEPGDTELLEAAGVPEHEAAELPG